MGLLFITMVGMVGTHRTKIRPFSFLFVSSSPSKYINALLKQKRTRSNLSSFSKLKTEQVPAPTNALFINWKANCYKQVFGSWSALNPPFWSPWIRIQRSIFWVSGSGSAIWFGSTVLFLNYFFTFRTLLLKKLSPGWLRFQIRKYFTPWIRIRVCKFFLLWIRVRMKWMRIRKPG